METRWSHLIPERSDRGFARLPVTRGLYLATVEIGESSLAESPHVWMRVRVPTDLNAGAIAAIGDQPYTGDWDDALIQLRAVAAAKLSQQLRYMVDNHYQSR